MNNLLKIAVPAMLAVASFSVNAAAITCGGAQRTATLDPSTACSTGTGNATAAIVNATMPFSGLDPLATNEWSEVGQETSAGASVPAMFDVSLTSGTWGSTPVTGTWTIASSFWTTYGNAAISMHVGNGGGDPDHWIWAIEQGATSGTFSYAKLTGTGGGLSNLKLYGAGDPVVVDPPVTPVSEPSILGLMGLGMIGLGLSRRRLAISK
jgi:hypothetical protein